MDLLILGGTRFLGRAIVDAALAAGHHVTLFHRGQTNPDLFPELEHILGDRDGGLDRLNGRTWDAVIDTCGYVPRLVRDSATLLADHVNHYTFISTISVYADPSQPIDEQSPLGTLDDATVEEVTGETYGPLKVLCEQAAHDAMNGRSLSVRSGLIVGPHDPTDRFTYWPVRVARGGTVLAPDQPDVRTQFIDVRDIAKWTISATEAALTGAYNVTGPEAPLTLGRFLDTCRQVTQSDAAFTWVDEATLLAHDVAPFSEIPLWVPAASAGMLQTDCQKAQAAGLTYRSLVNTIHDTLAWANGRAVDHEWRAGLTPQREADLLAAASATPSP